MSTTSIYRVTYHFEKNGRRISETFQDNCIAADSTFSSINTVLANNNKLGAGTLVIEGVYHVGAAGAFLS